MGRPKKDQELEFATHLSDSLIERVRKLSYRRCKKFDRFAFGYSWEDVAQRTLELLLVECQAGKLYVKVTDIYLLQRIRDSLRSVQVGNGNAKRGSRSQPSRGIFAAEDLDDFECGATRRSHSFAENIGADEQIVQLAAGIPLVDQARLRYEAAGCNWSRDFHNWLEEVLKDIQGEAAAAVNVACSTRDKALALTAQGTTAVNSSVVERLLEWIHGHEGRYFTHVSIGREVGAARETVSRLLQELIASGKVLQFSKEEGGPIPEGDKGRLSYSLVRK